MQPEMLVSHSVKASRRRSRRRHTNNLVRRRGVRPKLMREDSHIDLVAELTSSTDIQFGISMHTDPDLFHSLQNV